MKLKRNLDLVAAEMDGDIVMMSVETGTYYGLTGIAPGIWEALETPKTSEELFNQMLSLYDVEVDALRADLTSFLADMQKNGLVMST